MNLRTISLVLFLCLSDLTKGQDDVPSSSDPTECLGYGLNYCSACEDPGVLCYGCPSGYRLLDDYTGCVACSANCAECEEDDAGDVTCIRCNDGFGVIDGVCEGCHSTCKDCQTVDNVLECISCKDSSSNGRPYTLATDKTQCLECPVYCEECEDALGADGVTGDTACITCQHKYVPKQTDKTCIACPSDCDWCVEVAGKTSCSECDETYVINSVDRTSSTNACLYCPDSCEVCRTTASTVAKIAACTEANCAQGTLYKSDTKLCDPCVANCKICQNNTACQECKSYYYADKGTCQSCPYHCVDCDPNTLIDGSPKCLECDYRYGLKTPSPASCDQCPEDCIECVLGGSCTTCVSGYGVDTDGNCTTCPNFCTTCALSGSTMKCSVCDSLYALTTDKLECLDCPSGCNDSYCEYSKSLDSAICTACDISESPSTLNEDTGECVECPDLCQECTYNTTIGLVECIRCEEYNGLGSDGDCTACDAGCANCTYDSTFAVMQCVCIDRPIYGIIDPVWVTSGYGFRGVCNESTPEEYACDSNYYLETSSGIGVCTECTLTGCLVCNNNGSLTCEICQDGYQGPTTSGECKECPLNCVTCSLNSAESGTECDECVTNYGVLASTGGCSRCSDDNCLSCSFDSSNVETCNTCATEYVVNGNSKASCMACPECCNTCTYSSGDPKCKSSGCQAGCVHNIGECPGCPLNCISCKYDSSISGTFCRTCEDGYLVNPDTGVCDSCPVNCISCSYDGEVKVCDVDLCEVNYGRDQDGQCPACPENCAECIYDVDIEGLDCVACAAGYVLNEDQCGECPEYCLECTQEGSLMACSSCMDGYYVNSEQTCTVCDARCLTCTESRCTDCVSGYGVNSAGTGCEACATVTDVTNCDTCTKEGFTSVTCISCKTGNVLSDDKSQCISASDNVCSLWEDRGWKCTSCDDARTAQPNGSCAFVCSVCPGAVDGYYVDIDTCNTEGDTYENTTICYTQFCGAQYYQDGEYIGVSRGCGLDCTAASEDELCVPNSEDNSDDKTCERCCTGDACNNYVMSGEPRSVTNFGVKCLITNMVYILYSFL